ncbi:hypothetical protein HZC07_06165 [Candidatus Micrarchaeota archaeon]|nr:hypothetical protein [Candidatus Micrarchaeota archaeon]
MKIQICANCGQVVKESSDDFLCACGSNVCVVVPPSLFKKMVESGLAKDSSDLTKNE